MLSMVSWKFYNNIPRIKQHCIYIFGFQLCSKEIISLEENKGKYFPHNCTAHTWTFFIFCLCNSSTRLPMLKIDETSVYHNKQPSSNLSTNIIPLLQLNDHWLQFSLSNRSSRHLQSGSADVRRMQERAIIQRYTMHFLYTLSMG